VCPIYHMASSSIDTRNSRDVRRWVRAPLKQSHCMLLPLGAQRRTHALFCECLPFGPRWRSHFLCLDCLDLKVRLVHAGNLSRLRANGGLRSIRTKFSAHAKMRISNWFTARSLAPYDARQRTCDRRNRKRINRPCIALWDQRWMRPASGTSRKNSSSSVL
jgi:hypothetical protein